ncbi:LIM domain-binding protein 3-like [Micropterus dolomieu]|uniref:LIM domain-binding protein 3-like n=1 Tax=Micropterus dolomieu TaxID=147949 RepID=UPI001E8CDEE8|nr:LIM domain-binding protein 3-like [Micropterus dolomieu]
MSAYTVSLPGPGPWGFRLQGGKDFNMPLTISRITPGSKAAQGNLVQGDVIVAIDGVSTEGMTHLEAQNKIKMANYNLALTMTKAKRPVLMTTPRIDAAIPMIPHQQSVQVNGRLSACSASSGPAEADSPGGRAAVSPAQRKQYNSPIGLYSEDTLREMAAMQAGRPAGAGFNPGALDTALSTHKPIEVKGPGGKATIIHAQYNTPISMYSQDAIMDVIAGQTQGKGHDAGSLPVKDRLVDSASPVYQAVQSAEKDPDLGEWGRRSASMQSKTFRVLAHMTGTETLFMGEFIVFSFVSFFVLITFSLEYFYCTTSQYFYCTTSQYFYCTTSQYFYCTTSQYFYCTTSQHFYCTTSQHFYCTTSQYFYCTTSHPTEHAPACAGSAPAAPPASAASHPRDPAVASSSPAPYSPYAQPPAMYQAPQAPPPQQYQPIPQQYQPIPQQYQPIPQQYQQPPSQQVPPTQQSSIQIPLGSAPPKVVSTACIYPTQPASAPAPAPVPSQPRPPAAAPAPAPAPAGPASSNRPPWVSDTNFADKFDPSKTTTTTTVKIQPLPQAAPPPPAYIPNPSSSAPAAPSPAPVTSSPAPFPSVARGVAQRAERFAASSRTPLCGSCNSIIRGPFLVALGRSWHPEEFNCHYCHMSLADVSFVEEQNNVYCENCYEEFFAPTCARCNTKIMGYTERSRMCFTLAQRLESGGNC